MSQVTIERVQNGYVVRKDSGRYERRMESWVFTDLSDAIAEAQAYLSLGDDPSEDGRKVRVGSTGKPKLDS